MCRRPNHLQVRLCLALALTWAAVALAEPARTPIVATSSGRILTVRAMLADYSHPEKEVFWARDFWRGKLSGWSREGYSAVVWYGPNEFTNGEQVLVGHDTFPEARELSVAESKRRIDQMRWLFATGKSLGLQSFLLTQHIFFTDAFGKAHGLLEPQPVSPSVGAWHSDGYPNFWRGGERVYGCAVRDEQTRSYTEAVYAEIVRTYPDLDGFWIYNGEPLPGERSTFFGEAIAPALKRSGRRPLAVVNQWQTTLDGYLRNVAPESVYDNTWLGFHGYNSEQITDAKPYPGLVHWSEETGLPTVVDVYPANQHYFPFNSPRFAYEIATEMKKVAGIAGFLYYERHISGTLLGPLFRKALARYTGSAESYSEEPWIDWLEGRFGDRAAARHFLEAYDVSARIIPEMCALVYSGGDVMRRELRLPYAFFSTPFPWAHMTSPARGGRLVPVRHYAESVARDRQRFADRDGSDASRHPHYQHTLWGSEGGSIYNVTPPAHMRSISDMGRRCQAAAEKGLRTVTRNREEARRLRDIMEAYRLLTLYYERKVAAAIEALVYGRSQRPEDRESATRLADEALQAYVEAAAFMHEELDPFYETLTTSPLTEAGVPLPELIELERDERRDLAGIFAWPEGP